MRVQPAPSMTTAPAAELAVPRPSRRGDESILDEDVTPPLRLAAGGVEDGDVADEEASRPARGGWGRRVGRAHARMLAGRPGRR